MITDDGKVEFNEQEQKEIDRIIGERLGREGIHDMKEIVETLKTFNYTGTPAEIKAKLKADAEAFTAQLQESEKQKALEELQLQAQNTGTTPELLAMIKSLQEDLSEIKGEREAIKNAENERIAAQKMMDEQIKYFTECEDTKDIDLKVLNENPKFIKFLSKQKQTWTKEWLVEAYKDFVEIVGKAEADAIAKIQANLDRSTSSGKRSGNDGAGLLTPDEKAFVDEHNSRYPHMKMTYQEFYERKRR